MLESSIDSQKILEIRTITLSQFLGINRVVFGGSEFDGDFGGEALGLFLVLDHFGRFGSSFRSIRAVC